MTKTTVLSGFISVWFALIGCGGERGSTRAVSCEEICTRIEAPHCDNGPVKCTSTCEQERGGTPLACGSEIGALSECFADATFHCDADGVPQANDCKAELDSWLACSQSRSE